MTPLNERLVAIFNAKIKLPEAAAFALNDKWQNDRVLKRNEFLIKKDQTESSLFYVVDGSMRIYYPHQEDEICVGFAYQNSLICSYPSFILQKPSEYYIQALEKTTVTAISRMDFYNLFDLFPSIERSWRMLEEEALLGKIQREVEMLTFTPEERYTRLMERSPHVFQIIPRKYIASYLRMKPETLSRIRPH